MKKILLFSMFLGAYGLNAMEDVRRPEPVIQTQEVVDRIVLTLREKEVVVPIDFKRITLNSLIKSLTKISGINRQVVWNFYEEFVVLEEASYEDLTRFFLNDIQKAAVIDALIELGILQEDFYDYIREVIKQEDVSSEEALDPIRDQISALQARIYSLQYNLYTVTEGDFDRLTREIQDLEYAIMLEKKKDNIDVNTYAALRLNLEDLNEEISDLREKVEMILEKDERLARELREKEDFVVPSTSDDEEMARKLQEEEYGSGDIFDEEVARRLQEEDWAD
jgi:polyhydroxyalkanoate synthesis regulator phasin